MEMFGLFEEAILSQLISSAEDFPANRIPRRGGARVMAMNVICGRNTGASFARLNQNGSWLKTLEGSLAPMLEISLAEFFGIWPSSGMMRSGSCYRRAPLVHHIHAKECSLWPTPTVFDCARRPIKSRVQLLRRGTKSFYSKKSGIRGSIQGIVDWIAARDPLDRFLLPNPRWIEWLMGFPDNWTALDV